MKLEPGLDCFWVLSSQLSIASWVFSSFARNGNSLLSSLIVTSAGCIQRLLGNRSLGCLRLFVDPDAWWQKWRWMLMEGTSHSFWFFGFMVTGFLLEHFQHFLLFLLSLSERVECWMALSIGSFVREFILSYLALLLELLCNGFSPAMP